MIFCKQKDFLLSYLENFKLHVSKIFDLKIDENIIIDRIRSRSNIENRKDDNEDIIKIRISKYLEETKPLSDFYSSQYSDNYHEINGNQEIEMIFEDIIKFIKK